MVGAVFLVLGSASALWWPIGFLLNAETPDVVAEWAYAPALPVWQGLVLIALGLYIVGGLLVARQANARLTGGSGEGIAE